MSSITGMEAGLLHCFIDEKKAQWSDTLHKSFYYVNCAVNFMELKLWAGGANQPQQHFGAGNIGQTHFSVFRRARSDIAGALQPEGLVSPRGETVKAERSISGRALFAIRCIGMVGCVMPQLFAE